MKDLTANKGEWSEVYTLFKLLSEGKLYAADADLNKTLDLVYWNTTKSGASPAFVINISPEEGGLAE